MTVPSMRPAVHVFVHEYPEEQQLTEQMFSRQHGVPETALGDNPVRYVPTGKGPVVPALPPIYGLVAVGPKIVKLILKEL